jgi:excisionase family DNA binding protein
MKLEFEQEDLDKLTSSITQEVLKSLSPALSNQEASQDTIYTVETLAEYLQTTPKWIYAHISQLPQFRVGGLIRFRKKAIDRHFDKYPVERPNKSL